VLLSRDRAYAYLERVIVVEVTSRAYGIPQEVPLGRSEGLPRACVARFDNLAAIPKSRLRRRLGRVAAKRVPELREALGYALGWPELLPR
jgi:mRNA-degrading endonuclease toxin of MazEF toxin-antitoxin module